jgi:small-conductance mechanosensitive channel
MPKLRPDHRVVIGRNITLIAGAVYALSRCMYYAVKDPDSVSPAQGYITADGHLLWAWAVAWALTAALCIADMVNRHTRHGLSAVVGLAFAWGIAYLLMFIFSGFWDIELLSSAIGWLSPAGLVFGLLFKVTALQDMLRSKPELPEAP